MISILAILTVLTVLDSVVFIKWWSQSLYLKPMIKLAVNHRLPLILYMSTDNDNLTDQGKLRRNIVEAMKNARKSEQNKLSPGAELLSADEQSDAAYADLINTSMDQRLFTKSNFI